MTQAFPEVLIRRPTKSELSAAVAALHRQTEERHNLCGCYTALCRNPLYAGLEVHWRTYHPESLAILRDSQARRLLGLAQEASALRTPPQVR